MSSLTVSIRFLLCVTMAGKTTAFSDGNCQLIGAGTTAVETLFRTIFEKFKANQSISLDYDDDDGYSESVWSEFINGSREHHGLTAIDFIVGEGFASQENENPEVVKVPILSEALVLVYNLPGVTSLNLSFVDIYSILKNSVSYWNDSNIQASNPGTPLPGEKIIPIVRARGSGQTRSFLAAFGITKESDIQKSEQLLEKTKNTAQTASAMATAVSVVAYSFGYVDSSTAVATGLSYIKDLAPTIGQKFSFTPWLNYTNSSFSATLYLFFNKTRLQTDCCKAQELVGFVHFLQDNKSAQTIIANQFGLLPPKERNNALDAIQDITCDGKNMLEEYLKSREPIEKQLGWWDVLRYALIGLVFLVLVGIGVFLWRRRLRRKIEEQKLWIISGDKLKMLDMSRTVFGLAKSSQIHGRNRTTDNDSLMTSLQFTMNIGIVEEATVFVSLMDSLTNPKKWSASTRAIVAAFRRDISNSHVLGFIGIVGFDDRVLCVMEFCGKGTLHHVITAAKHEINDAIKFNLALDVADGMNYLQKKQITHGMLNSLTCYIDFKWTVKISNWLDQSVHNSEHSTTLVNKRSMTQWSDHAEHLVLLLYTHPKLLVGATVCSSCDTYSFGMLLVEIFTRDLPFALDVRTLNLARSFRSIIEDKREMKQFEVPMLPPTMPVAVNKLIRQCICTNQHDFASIFKILRSQTIARKGVVDIMMEAIQKYADNLEEKVAERTAELNALTERMQDLLHQVLPPDIATKLFNGQCVEPEYFDCVTVLFLDVCGFTAISAISTPTQVMTFLNQLWIAFDAVIEHFDVYKVDTIGDAYMVCSGLPQRNGILHVKHICGLANAILSRLKTFTIPHIPNLQLKIRIGINSGPVTAGIVGNKMPQYCVFGDAVNTAARMEQTSLPLRIHVSEATAELIQQNFPEFQLKLRGDIDIKGKGTMKTYWLVC